MSAAVTLAVQVVNYRTRPYLERCLETVVPDLEDSALEYEINLLDNASGESIEHLERIRCARTFAATRNLGFGGGHNLLAARTSATYLLILNPDVEFLLPGTAERLVEVASRGDGVLAVGPRLLTTAGAAQPYDHGRLHGARAQIALRGGHSYWRATETGQDVAWVSGAVLLVDRAAFTGVGGFDENLFLYKEDEDLCLRLRLAGGRIRYEPSIVVRHEGSVVADRQAGLERACAYFNAKHHANSRTRELYSRAHRWMAYLRL